MIRLATKLVNLGRYSAILLTKDVLEKADLKKDDRIIVNIESLNEKQKKDISKIRCLNGIKEVFV